MGKPKDEVVLRFAVGSVDGPRSAVWRLWTHRGKNDVYIAARTLVGVHKVSLHQSGVWRFAFTPEYWANSNWPWSGEGDRLIERWKRPPPIMGITPAFMIIVPSAEIGLPRHPLPERAKKYTEDVTWVDPAPEGFATHFTVMYTDPGGPEPAEHNRFVDRFELPNGQMVSILIEEHVISEENQRLLEAARQAMSEVVTQGRTVDREALEAALEPRGYLYGQNEHGTRFFVDISGAFLFE